MNTAFVEMPIAATPFPVIASVARGSRPAPQPGAALDCFTRLRRVRNDGMA
jgi:hypothetical protein